MSNTMPFSCTVLPFALIFWPRGAKRRRVLEVEAILTVPVTQVHGNLAGFADFAECLTAHCRADDREVGTSIDRKNVCSVLAVQYHSCVAEMKSSGFRVDHGLPKRASCRSVHEYQAFFAMIRSSKSHNVS